MKNPSRGEVWWVNLNPTEGREQAGDRPCLIVSINQFNHGPADLLIVTPITHTDRSIPMHVKIPSGNKKKGSFILCDQIRTISKSSLRKFEGIVSIRVMKQVSDRLRTILNLPHID